MAALAGCLAALGSTIGLTETVRGPGDLCRQLLGVALIPLCAFCGAPFLTLVLRHEIGGMVFAAATPFAIVVGDALVTGWLFEKEIIVTSSTSMALLVIYCAATYWLGYRRFMRLQVVDGPSRELSLPASLEAYLTRPLTRLFSRCRWPFAALLKKELHLQQLSFVLAGLFVLIALAGACLVWLHSERGGLMLAGDFVIYVLLLPFIAGAVSVAEEKGWDLAEWHLTLPPSAFQQWSAKMWAAFSTSLVLGLVLPVILLLVGDELFAKGDALDSLPPTAQILCLVLGQLLLTSLAIYAASFSSTTLKAILAAFALIIAGCAVCGLSGAWEQRHAYYDHMSLRIGFEAGQDPSAYLLAASLLSVLCVVQCFAGYNFRRFRLPASMLLGQLAVILLCVGIGTLISILRRSPLDWYWVHLRCAGLGALAVIVSVSIFRPVRRGGPLDRFRVVLLWVAIGALVLVLLAFIDCYRHPGFGLWPEHLWRWIR